MEKTLLISKRRYTCADLFAGAGGYSLGAQKAGFDIKVVIEFDKHAAATYRRNIYKNQKFPPAVLEKNITDLNPATVFEEHFGSGEECDLLLGGPPCQGFSTHRINDTGVSDIRNQLILTYFDFVRAFRPRVFLMENVPGILWKRHQLFLDKFYTEGLKSGYSISKPVVIDARDFGIPQRRKRVFVLGTRTAYKPEGFIWPPLPTHGNEVAIKVNPKLESWINCTKIFSKPLPKDGNEIHMNHGPELIEAFKKTPSNGGSRKDSGRVLPCHADHDGHKDVYGRINPFLPAPTMTTACINPSKGRFVHPTEHHGITLRHAARIQTFPDNFVFEGGLTAGGKQIGNAVPVDMGFALIEHLKLLIDHQTVDHGKAA